MLQTVKETTRSEAATLSGTTAAMLAIRLLLSMRQASLWTFTGDANTGRAHTPLSSHSVSSLVIKLQAVIHSELTTVVAVTHRAKLIIRAPARVK